MADIIDENGLQLSTRDELIDDLKTGFEQIYGTTDEGINFGSETPDGQLINIFAQSGEICRELISQLYNSFDPDTAQGNLLDQRVKLNNITRKAGSFSTTPINITVNKTVTLAGLDENFSNTEETGYVVTDYDSTNSGYTVQDDAGNEWYLVNTTQLIAATTTSCLFRAKEMGAIESAIGTITTPVTIVSGVVNVSNDSSQLTIGTDRETDTQLKIRRRRSTFFAGQNSCDSIEAAVLELEGVTDCRCYENYGQTVNTPQKNGEDIPLHSVWLVVTGSGDADKIAEALYNKNGYARPMVGDIQHIYTNPTTGRNFYAKWDNATGLLIHLKFDVKMTGLQRTISEQTKQEIKDTIVSTARFYINSPILASDFAKVCQEAIDNNGVVGGVALNILFSEDGEEYKAFIDGKFDKIFTLSDEDIEITVV